MSGDRPEPLTSLDEVRADHNIVAAVAGIDRAREAILALERSGVPGEEIALLGAQPEPVPDTDEPGPSAGMGRSAAEGATAGAVGAGAAGALVGVAVPGIGPAVAAGLWALGGAAAGGVLGGVATAGDSEAWRQTYQVVQSGNFAVGVHTNDTDLADVAEATLTELEPMSINRFEG